MFTGVNCHLKESEKNYIHASMNDEDFDCKKSKICIRGMIYSKYDPKCINNKFCNYKGQCYIVK